MAFPIDYRCYSNKRFVDDVIRRSFLADIDFRIRQQLNPLKNDVVLNY